MLAARTKLSAPQTHAPLLPRVYGRETSRCRSPPGPGFPSVPDASLVVSLMGHLARLPQNTTWRGAQSQRDPRPRLPRSSSPQAARPGSFLLAKQRINNQPSNRREERLQQTLMTTRAPFFPRIVSDTRGRREATNMYVFATISLPSKKECWQRKGCFSLILVR